MKTIHIFLLLLTSLSAFAKPEFEPLPGTPDSLAAPQTVTNQFVVPAIRPAAPASNSFTGQTTVQTPAAKAVVTQTVVKPVSQVVTQTVTQTVTRVVSPAVTQAVTHAAPPTMPAAMRSGTPGGFSVIRTSSSNVAATNQPAAISRTPQRLAPVVQPANASQPIEMQASAGTTPAAANVSVAPASVAPAPAAAPVMVVTPVVVKPTEAVVVQTPAAPVVVAAAAPVAQTAPATPSSTEFTVPNSYTAPKAVRTVPPPSMPAASQPAFPAIPAAVPTAAVAPAVPGVPVLPAAPRRPPQAAPEEFIPAGVVRFQNAPLEQVLDYYSDMVKRTLLRPATLPTASITINTKTDLTKQEVIEALDSVLGLNGIAMIPVGEKFLKVVPIAQANQEAAPLGTQTAEELPELGQYVTHVVQLKYSKPSEVATVLQQFAKVPNSVFPIDSNGILILRDYTENVKRMLEMIDRIDVSVPSEFVSEVIPIKYALADDIQSALSSISGSGSGGTAGSHAPTTGARPLAGMQNPSASGNGAYGQNRTTTGSLGANGATGASGAAGAQQTFAQRLQNIIQKSTASGGDIQLIGPNKIIADERTNSLLVFATREDMATIKDIISKLDVVLAQVLIEAIILDVTLGDTFSLGVSGGQRPQASGSSAFGGLINNANGQLGAGNGFLNNLVQNFTTNIVDGATNITSTFTPASSITYPNNDGLNYFGTLNNTWDFSLSALAGDNNVKVLARPRIQTSHAVAANIFVGETRPYVTGTYFNSGVGGTSSSQYEQTQIGISLNVLPLINTEGLVVMDIQQQVQQVGGSVTIDGNDVPITQDQSASAKVAVYSGQTIVLGGFIQNQNSDTRSGVPWLKDIPLLGALFRSTSTSNNRRELLVMIRPTVLPTPSVAALQPDIERKRLPGIRQAEEEFSRDQEKRNKRIPNGKAADLDSQ